MASPRPSPHLLQSKTAAITGGTTGIGAAIALEYVRQGCNVAVNHLDLERDAPHRDALVAAAASLLAADPLAGWMILVTGDIAREETGKELVAAAVREWGRLDVFVSNAGMCQFQDFLSMPTALLEQTVSIKLLGAYHACRTAATQMSLQYASAVAASASPSAAAAASRSSGGAPAPPAAAAAPSGGCIIGIASISALVGGPQQTHDTPTKAGVLSPMQSLACALAPQRSRCNALLPGAVRTQLNAAAAGARIPAGRTGHPRGLAGPAVFLAADERSGYVNGAQLLVDGAMLVNLQ